MIKTKLEKLIIKNLLAVLFSLSILDVIFIKHKWILLIGLVIGSLISILKFSILTNIISALLLPNINNVTLKSILVFLFNQAIAVLILIIVLKTNIHLFWGVLAGILMVPLIIMLNSITEVLGITNNKFQ